MWNVNFSILLNIYFRFFSDFQFISNRNFLHNFPIIFLDVQFFAPLLEKRVKNTLRNLLFVTKFCRFSWLLFLIHKSITGYGSGKVKHDLSWKYGNWSETQREQFSICKQILRMISNFAIDFSVSIYSGLNYTRSLCLLSIQFEFLCCKFCLANV